MGCKKFAAKCDSRTAKRIRTIAKDSSCVYLIKHLKVRMAQCKVTAIEVLDCIRNGIISRAPEQSLDGQSLEYLMARYVAGRNLSVVVALCVEDPDMILVTAFLVG